MCILSAMYPVRTPLAWEKKAGMLLITELLSNNSSTMNKDATGLGTVAGNVWKWEESAQKLIYTPEFNNIVETIVGSPFIAHVRTTSSGLTAKDGAHPYHVGQILLAHNGTLSGYQKYVKEYASILKSDDPVDSHVLACLLAKACGTGKVTPDAIKEALTALGGSYTLLVVDVPEKRMWAVVGSNPLFTMNIGPYCVVNTSGTKLKETADFITEVTRLLYKHELPVGKPTAIPKYTINTIDATGVTKVGDAPKRTVIPVTTWRAYQAGVTSRGYQAGFAGGTKEKETFKVAEDVFAIIDGGWPTIWEVITACQSMGTELWWSMTEEEVEILSNTLSDENLVPTHEQAHVWEGILKALEPNVNPYVFLGDLLDLEFPYSLNTKEHLIDIYEILTEVQDDSIAAVP